MSSNSMQPVQLVKPGAVAFGWVGIAIEPFMEKAWLRMANPNDSRGKIFHNQILKK